MQHLDLLRRFIGTSLLWFFFGAIGLVMTVLVFPFLYVFVWKPSLRQRAARWIIATTFGAFMRGGKWMGVFSFRVTGMEHRNAKGGQLILANHPTLIDVVLLLSVLPQVDCVVKDAVVRNPFMKAFVTTANYISNRDPAEFLAACAARLESGASLLLFPEGTRSGKEQRLQFKLGAAEIAIRANAPILPVVIKCEPLCLGKQDPWYRIPRSRPHFEVTVLPAIPAEQLAPEGLGRKRARHELNDALVSLFDTELA